MLETHGNILWLGEIRYMGTRKSNSLCYMMAEKNYYELLCFSKPEKQITCNTHRQGIKEH